MTDQTETPDLAELRRLLDDVRALATREGIYNGNRAVLDIIGRVEPLLDAAAERDELAAKVEALADWHETKADKARWFRVEIDGQNRVMDKAAEVHTDAARRLRHVLTEDEETQA